MLELIIILTEFLAEQFEIIPPLHFWGLDFGIIVLIILVLSLIFLFFV